MFECPIVVILNLSRDGSITTFFNMAVASLFALVLARDRFYETPFRPKSFYSSFLSEYK
jgi:hypothetical protein